MTDIVTLLRSRCNCNIDSSPCGAQECCREDREAAAEIERLRDLVRELRGAAEDLLPYATAAIGLPEPLWPSDSVILRARAAIEKAKEVS